MFKLFFFASSRLSVPKMKLTPRRQVAKIKTGLMQDLLTGTVRVTAEEAEEVAVYA